MSEQISKSYSLASSKEGLGELVPVLYAIVDGKEEIIDGFHRIGENANWRKELIPWIKTREQLEAARLAVNFARREMAPEEVKERVTNLLKMGLKAEEIAKLTGIGESTVYKYKPQELKDPKKVEIGQKGGQASALRVEQDKRKGSTQAGTCKKCHIQSYSLSPEGYCSVCSEKVAQEPQAVNKNVSHESTDEGADKQEEKSEFTKASESKEARELCSCPICGTVLSKDDFELCREEVGIKYGPKIQAKLFREEQEGKEAAFA